MLIVHHFAQINIGRILAPIGDPLMAEFVSQLPIITALADETPGFVWRFQTESGDAAHSFSFKNVFPQSAE